MITKNIQIDEIIRFHNTIEKITSQIDEETNDAIKLKLFRTYHHLLKMWNEFDNSIEKLKTEIDIIENK